MDNFKFQIKFIGNSSMKCNRHDETDAQYSITYPHGNPKYCIQCSNSALEQLISMGFAKEIELV